MRVILRPLFVVAVALMAREAAHGADAVRWQPSLESAQHLAAQSGRMVLVHFYTDSCAPCAQLDRNVFSQLSVAQAVEQSFVPVKLNANDFPARATQWGVTSVPSDVILSSTGQVITTVKGDGRWTPQQYLAQIQRVPGVDQNSDPIVAQASPPAAPARTNALPMQAHMPPQQGAPSQHAMGVHSPAQTQTSSRVVASQHVTDMTQPGNAPATGASEPPSWARGFAQSQQPEGRNSVEPQPTNIAAPSFVGQQQPTSNAQAFNSPQAASPTSFKDSSSNQAAVTSRSDAPSWADNNTSNAAAMQRAAIGQPSAPNVVHFGEIASAHSQPQSSAPSQVHQQLPSFAQRPPVQEPPQVSLAAQTPPKPQSEFGLDGHCPVTLVDQLHLPAEQQRWIKGDPRWGAVHRGRTYLFAGPEQQQRFLASPDLYSPALSGNDPILSFTHGVPVPGQRAFGVAYNNRMYLFASEDTLKQFWDAPDHYAATVLQAEQPTHSRLR